MVRETKGFLNKIRRRNSVPARKTTSFKAFQPMELVCLFFCLNKSKACFRLNRKDEIL